MFKFVVSRIKNIGDLFFLLKRKGKP